MGKPWTGATGRFPQGMLNAEDDGELQMAVASDPIKRIVIIDFGTPVKWLGLPAKEARKLAAMLLRCTQELEDRDNDSPEDI